MDQDINPIFERNVPGTTVILQGSVIGIAGCGGLGSNAAISLARAGAGKLILADCDTVELSNLNRQAYFRTDVGKPKTEALAEHLRSINPGIELILHQVELTPDNLPETFSDADLLIEAFDRAESKKWLIQTWCAENPDRPVIVGSGIGGLGKTGELKVHSSGNIHICGDEWSSSEEGLCAARVSIVANMQANTAISLLTELKG
ncbi:MAG: sulfur carrier protein ThiS adenylyltransferase ThiF [Candidatus Latescibacteria bacterium]|nr:sulfur carrier protein ThiS adenylyltransferase ThiF [bacterium]MBD3423979.1 sulfur carrier protein ThiS adenylyltransferase ThiF [Candidatus Latescibacterota bacterium]